MVFCVVLCVLLCLCVELRCRVIETPTPVNVSAIRGKWLREHINDKAGCCGAAELIKLYSYRLVEYDWVIHLDADVLIFQVWHIITHCPISCIRHIEVCNIILILVVCVSLSTVIF